jgi:hypothetical protein
VSKPDLAVGLSLESSIRALGRIAGPVERIAGVKSPDSAINAYHENTIIDET